MKTKGALLVCIVLISSMASSASDNSKVKSCPADAGDLASAIGPGCGGGS